MRGLHTAGVLLTPALAGAIALEGQSRAVPDMRSQHTILITDTNLDSIPRAFISIPLREPIDSAPSRDLVFRFDINESQDACGYGNVTINGQKLSEDGSGPLTLDGDRVVDAAWNFTCVTWNDKPQEQLLSLNVEHVNGRAVQDVGFTVRFQQVAPVWISDVEGSASMTRIHSSHQDQSEPDCDDKELDLDTELAELDYLRWQMAELAHLLRAKEHRLAEAFGWERHHGPGPRIHECDSLKCVIEAIAHTVKGAASSIYGGGEGHGPHGHHGTGPHPHGLGDEHRGGPHHRFGKPGHGNHTENGTHPFPPPPHGKKPHFPHPPPFCKCAPPPPPPHHGDHPPPPPPHGDHPPPPPPPPQGAWPPPPPPPPPHGDFPPPPPGPGFGPPPPHHGGPGFWESLFGFVHPHGPPPPMPWERPDWEHPGPDSHLHHGHGHGHEGGPPRMGHEGHHGQADEGHEKEHGHHEGHQHTNEPERLDQPEGKPEHQDHGDHQSADEFKGPEIKANEQEAGRKDGDLPIAHPEKPQDSRPARPEDHHVDMPWEAELRRAHDHGPQPHDGPHDHDEFQGHHPPPPPGPPPPGPPPPGHHPHGPPHGSIFIHIASAISSLVLLVVFGSVLYQRYVRKSIRSPRVRRNSSAPWYKRLCFGPNYSELSEDEEKEAMLRNCGDSNSDSDEDDSDVVARDISHFRTAADVVGEMVAVEEARMGAHSRQPSFSPGPIPAPAPAPVPVPQQHMPQQMRPYIPTHLMPASGIPMPISMPTGQLSPDPATMAAMAAMFPDLVQDLDMDLAAHHGGGMGVGGEVPGEELPAYQEADRQSESDESEFASSMVTDGYRPGCSGSSYTPSESGSQGAGDILGDTKN